MISCCDVDGLASSANDMAATFLIYTAEMRGSVFHHMIPQLKTLFVLYYCEPIYVTPVGHAHPSLLYTLITKPESSIFVYSNLIS